MEVRACYATCYLPSFRHDIKLISPRLLRTFVRRIKHEVFGNLPYENEIFPSC